MIGEPILVRGPRPLEGEIVPGEVFAWEPDLPWARELVIVRRVYERGGTTWIEAWDMDYTRTVQNEEGRFREAAYRTMFNRFPSEKPRMLLEPLPEGFFKLKRAG
jgi:hypothetical protein